MTSVAEQIADAIKVAIDATSFDGIASIKPEVIIRRRVIIREADLDYGTVIIVGIPDDTIKGQSFGGIVELEYLVPIAIAGANNNQYKVNLGLNPSFREKLRQALHTTSLSGVTSVYDIEIDLKPTFDSGAIQGAMDYSELGIRVRTAENRNG